MRGAQCLPESLLAGCGRQFDWTLVPEYAIKRPPAKLIKVDGALLDTFRLTHGFWEAKDEHDDLEREIRRKLEQGYPRNNIILPSAPERAILIQERMHQGLPDDIRDSGNLVELLKTFFAYREPYHEEWDEAIPCRLETRSRLGQEHALIQAGFELLFSKIVLGAVGCPRRGRRPQPTWTPHGRTRARFDGH